MWHIGSDHIDLGANLNSTSATLHFDIDALDPTKSGFLNVQGSARMDGYVNFRVTAWNRTQSTNPTPNSNLTLPRTRTLTNPLNPNSNANPNHHPNPTGYWDPNPKPQL